MVDLVLIYFVVRKVWKFEVERVTYAQLDEGLLRLESRFGKLGWAVLFALGLMLLAGVYVQATAHPNALGQHYAELAAQPFSPEPGNPVQLRILTPLISYLVGLRGNLILVTNLIFAAALVVLVYLWFRGNAERPGDAFFAGTVLTFSLVTLTTVYFGGYPDSLTFLIVFAMWWSRARPFWFHLLFLLGLLNHECIAFLAPWFLFLRANATSRRFSWLADLLVLVAVLGLYLLGRGRLSQGGEGVYSLDYYLEPMRDNPLHWFDKSFVTQGLGMFSVFKLLWVVPVLAVVSLYRRGSSRLLVSIALLMGCAYAQHIVAFDTSRLWTLGYMVMVISLAELFRSGDVNLRGWIGWLMLANLAVPQLFTAEDKIVVMKSQLLDIISRNI